MSRYEVAASTSLQMLLYFNALFSLVWGLAQVLYFQWKSRNFEPPMLAAVVSPMIFWGWVLLEPIRLLLGCVGNLGERVAWLSGFWVLTCFPQLVVHVYFIVGQRAVGWFSEPLELTLSSFFIALYLAELTIGWRATRVLMAKARAEFHQRPMVEAAANSV